MTAVAHIDAPPVRQGGGGGREGVAVTEAEWNACSDPQPMLEFLRGKASDGKLRMFAVACCRRHWHLLRDEPRLAIEVSELYAHGLEERRKVEAAVNAVEAAVKDAESFGEDDGRAGGAIASAAWAVAFTVTGSLLLDGNDEEVQDLAWDALTRMAKAAAEAGKEESEPSAQAELLRDIFGNPFRPVTLDPVCLTSTVTQLAEAIYDERAFDRIPILADALEDAGCTNTDILEHCRGGGEHVRGCWVMDLLLWNK